MHSTVQTRFDESMEIIKLTRDRLTGPLVQAVEMVVAALQADRGIFLFGNGGSAADAQHVAAELVGRYLLERRGYRAQALTTDSSILTAVGNDYGFDQIFARQIQGCARSGDVAIGFSTSGNSTDVLLAFEQAKAMGMGTIAFTGQGGGKIASLADVLLDVPSSQTPRIQESHAVLYHTLCELVETTIEEDTKPGNAG